jgi:hypothetical protein
MGFLLSLPNLLQAQKPETIFSFARHPQSMQWYTQQKEAWAKVVSNHPKDNKAWYNYYYVTRILNNHNVNDKRSRSEKDKELSEIVDRMSEQIPDSYDYNFCRWQLQGNDMKYYSFLEKAISIDSNRTEHIDYMINIGEIDNKPKQRDQYSARKFDVGELSPGFMYYNYNVLSGLEPDAILLTAGDNDTYPAWALQGRGIRKDVKVLNVYLLQIDRYRERVFRELGAEPVSRSTDSDEENFRKHIIESLTRNQKNHPIYIALTASNCDEYLNTIQDKLYLTGLAYRYDTSSFDNTAVLRRNFEKRYALDYLDKAFYVEPSEERMHEINTNYLVPMLKLHEHYQLSGNTDQDEWIKEKILMLCKNTEYEADIKKRLSEK